MGLGMCYEQDFQGLLALQVCMPLQSSMLSSWRATQPHCAHHARVHL